MRRLMMLCFAVSALSFAGTGFAQEKGASDPDQARKLELAKEMHKIRPARKQVEEAVGQVSRNLPPLERDRFMKMVEKAFDYDSLEKLSTDTMVELFTVPELEKMVGYFGSDEAKAIEKKLPKYQEKLQPEIIRMLDAAMIAERTGNAPAPTSAPKPADNKRPVEDASTTPAENPAKTRP